MEHKMRKALVVLGLLSVMTTATADSYTGIETTVFVDEFSQFYRADIIAYGKENSSGYLVLGGITAVESFDGNGTFDGGGFIGVEKYYNEHARLRSRLYYYEDNGLLGQATLFGKTFVNNVAYYGQCQKQVIDNTWGITTGTTYVGCDGSLEWTLGDFGLVAGAYRFDFSDDNQREGNYFKGFYDFDENFRLSLNYRDDGFALDSDEYFSPDDWEQTYAMVHWKEEILEGFTNHLGVGYGEERIDGFTRNPVYLEYKVFWDTGPHSLFGEIKGRMSSDYKFIWSTVGYRYRWSS